MMYNKRSIEIQELSTSIDFNDDQIILSIEASGGWDAGSIDLRRPLKAMVDDDELRAIMQTEINYKEGR
jgi:hypothetical protein